MTISFDTDRLEGQNRAPSLDQEQLPRSSKPSSGLLDTVAHITHLISPRACFGLLVLGLLTLSGCSVSEKSEPEASNHLLTDSTAVTLDLSNTFPVNEARILPEAEAALRVQIHKLLGQYDSPQLVGDLAQMQVRLEIASDERNTKSWKDGNLGLSLARVQEVEGLVQVILGEYRFSDSTLLACPDAPWILTEKQVSVTFPGADGVRRLSDLVNPKTGSNYTEAEISRLTHSQKEALYDQARHIQGSFVIPANPREAIYAEIAQSLGRKYEDVILLCDRSESMLEDYRLFARKLSEEIKKVPGLYEGDRWTIVPFETNAFFQLDSTIIPIELEDYFRKFPLYGGDERVFTAVDTVLRDIGEMREKRRALVVLTDEGIQDFSGQKLDDLVKLAEEKGVDVQIILLGESRGEHALRRLSLQALQAQYQAFLQSLTSNEWFMPPANQNPADTAILPLKAANLQLVDGQTLRFSLDYESYSWIYYNIDANYTQRWEELQSRTDSTWNQIAINQQQQTDRIEGLRNVGVLDRQAYSLAWRTVRDSAESERRSLRTTNSEQVASLSRQAKNEHSKLSSLR